MLQKLPVPDHGLGFWEGLDVRLQARSAPRPTPIVAPARSPAPDPGPATAPVPIAAGASRSAPDLAAAGASTLRTAPAPAEPEPVPLLPPAIRRKGNVALAVLSVAAVVAVVVAGTTLVRDDTREPGVAGTSTTVAGDGAAALAFTGTTAAPASPSGIAADPAPPLEAAAGEATSPESAVATLVVAVDEGAADRVWALLAEPSQRHWGEPGEPAAAIADLAASGYGRFRGAEDLDVSTVVLAEDGGTEVGVVVLDGIVEVEGGRARATAELPYRRDVGDGTTRLDPWAPGVGASSPIRFTSPVPAGGEAVPYGTILRVDDPTVAIEVAVPAWATRVVVAVDGEEVLRADPSGTGDGGEGGEGGDGTGGTGNSRGTATVRFVPDAPFAPGVHRITVAAVGGQQVTGASILLKAP